MSVDKCLPPSSFIPHEYPSVSWSWISVLHTRPIGAGTGKSGAAAGAVFVDMEESRHCLEPEEIQMGVGHMD